MNTVRRQMSLWFEHTLTDSLTNFELLSVARVIEKNYLQLPSAGSNFIFSHQNVFAFVQKVYSHCSLWTWRVKVSQSHLVVTTSAWPPSQTKSRSDEATDVYDVRTVWSSQDSAAVKWPIQTTTWIKRVKKRNRAHNIFNEKLETLLNKFDRACGAWPRHS